MNKYRVTTAGAWGHSGTEFSNLRKAKKFARLLGRLGLLPRVEVLTATRFEGPPRLYWRLLFYLNIGRRRLRRM